MTATASDDVGVTSVQFLVDGAALGEADTTAPYEVAWPTDGATNGAHTLTAVARDAAGHETTSTISVAVLNDTAAPTVTITSPTNGTTLGGTVTVTASAADDVGVTSVQFLVDGAALGDPDTTAPYEVAWPTGGLPNGAHTLAAVARDAAGHESTSTISVAVINDIDGADGGGDEPDQWQHGRRDRDADRDRVGRCRRDQRAVPDRRPAAWCRGHDGAIRGRVADRRLAERRVYGDGGGARCRRA